ncbi:MAG: hypothetical protein Q9174_004445, partial [Haloplaca sp. 1 TL-2023]
MDCLKILGEIPADPFGTRRQVLSTEVISFRGLSPKKTSEVALAVNSIGINVYDVQSGHANASYAVSPSTTFTCPPCAIKLPEGSNRGPVRLTYCAVLNPKPQVLCFSEEIRRGIDLGGKLNTSTVDLPDGGQPIVHIEAIPTRHDTDESVSVHVLCVRQDGLTYCYDMALQAQQWTSPIPLASDGDQSLYPIQVLHASSVSLQQATESLLVSRQDLVDLLEAKRDYFASTLLLLITRPRPESSADDDRSLVYRILGIKNIGNLKNEGSSFGKNNIKELASLVVPEPLSMRQKEASFKLHHSSGTLYQATNKNLAIYDLRTLSPRLLRTVDFPLAKDILSFARISSDIAAITSMDSVMLTNTKFSKEEVLLIDAIGRGSLLPTGDKISKKRLKNLQQALGRPIDTFKAPDGWVERRKLLDALWKNGNLVEFDRKLLSKKDSAT